MKNTRGKRTVAGNGIRTKTGREERNEGRKEIEEVLNKYELDFFKNTQMPSDSLIFPYQISLYVRSVLSSVLPV